MCVRLTLQQVSDVTVYDGVCVRLTCYSSVSYIDDLVGDVLQKLEDLRLENDTVVMLMSDHGWHLSESSSVCVRARMRVTSSVTGRRLVV